jgi:hypothetical protein
LLGLTALIFLPSCLTMRSWAPTGNALPGEAGTILARAGEVEVLSLEPGRFSPRGPEEAFHGFRVLGRTTVTGKARRQVVRAIEEGIANSDGSVASCFNPRHAVRATYEGRTVELVLCFECKSLRIYLDGQLQPGPLTSASPQAVLDRILTEAGVPLAPNLAGWPAAHDRLAGPRVEQ